MHATTMFSLLRRGAAMLQAGLAGLLVCGVGAAWAGFITTNEAGLDSIFAQSGFGSQTIDARFNAGRSVANTALLSIDSDAGFNSLFSLPVYSLPATINMFFVDTITFCGTGGNFIGCASNSGNVIVLDSSWAASASFGADLAAHELGHNLGLDHVTGSGTNLMNPIISTNFSLDAGQIATILNSSLVQTAAGGQRFLSITPIAVVAAVPEPQIWVMLGVGLLGITGWVRRRRACTV